MTRLSYDSVEALIYDPVSSNRTATRSALYSLGFRLTETVSTLDTMVEAIRSGRPISCCARRRRGRGTLRRDPQLRQGGRRQSIRRHHRHRLGEIDRADQRMVNSGADDLLLRPFSTTLLGQRIEAHIERRKGFVITTDYVGPDRARTSRGAAPRPYFPAAQFAEMKAKEKLPSDAIAKKLGAELKVAREKLHHEKLRRDAFQLCILWR